MNEFDLLKQDFVKNITTIPQFKKVFIKETDRGCALLAASLLDNELKELLSKHFVDNNNIQKKLFSVNGPLGTLSSKIDLSFVLGFVSKKDSSRLHIIREIRNDFGHSFKNMDFNDTKVSQKIKSIALEYHNTKYKIRNIFIDVINKLLIGLYLEIFVINKRKELPHSEVIPKEVISKYKADLKKKKPK